MVVKRSIFNTTFPESQVRSLPNDLNQLSGASLVGSRLEGASYSGATLYGADLTNASLSLDDGTYTITLLDYVNEIATDKTLSFDSAILPFNTTDGNTTLPLGRFGTLRRGEADTHITSSKPEPVDVDSW